MKNLIQGFEAWFDQQSTQKRLVYAGIFLIFVAMLLLNHYVYMMHDDYIYSVLTYGESFQFPESLIKVYQEMKAYYLTWGGRMVATTSTHLMLLLPISLQDLINALVFMILLCCSYKMVKKKNANNVLLLVLIFISIFIFAPTFVASAVWITGSGGFLWTMTLSVLFIYPYIKTYNEEGEYENSAIRIVGIFLFGILAGCSNENLGVGLVMLTLLYTFLLYREKNITAWHISGLIGVSIGCAIMIFSPGTALRAVAEEYPSLFSSLDILPQKVAGLWGYYKYFLRYPFIVYAICMVLFWYTYQGDNKRKILTNSLAILFVANFILWISIFAPTFPPRAFFSVTVFTVISFAMLYAHIEFKNIGTKAIHILLLSVLLGFFVWDYTKTTKSFRFIYNVEQERIRQIDEYKAKGIDAIEFERAKIDYYYNYMESGEFRSYYYQMDISFIDIN